MMPDVPLVSIVTPAYNASEFLEELFRSVEAQDYAAIEHIVIDDGSTDGGATSRILHSHPAARSWSRQNRGQYPTLNEGFRAATGDYITTISADDFYVDASAIRDMAEYLTARQEVDVVHGTTRYVDSAGVTISPQPFQRFPYWMLRYNLAFIPHCSMLVRRNRLFERSLLFDEALRFTGDGDWMARMYLAGLRFGRIDRDIAAYRQHGGQTTTVAHADPVMLQEKRAERAAVDLRYQASPTIGHLVRGYVVAQQRRVKLSAVFRSGGLGCALSSVWRCVRGESARRRSAS